MSTLKERVKQEADNIKKFATPEEIGKLDIKNLRSYMADGCVYGLMTGNCRSIRAIELLEICSIPYSTSIKELFFTNKLFKNNLSVFSALEFYINQRDAKNANLIAYLKSEVDTLEL